MGTNNAGLDVFQGVVIETQFGRLTASQVIPYHVSSFDQFFE